jgi:hypothetical protein
MVEIASGVDSGATVLHVRIVDERGNEVSNFDGLPIEFRRKISPRDITGRAVLKKAVSS